MRKRWPSRMEQGAAWTLLPYRKEKDQAKRGLSHCYTVREKHLACAEPIRVLSLGFLNCEIEGQDVVSRYVAGPRPPEFWDSHKTCFLSYGTRQTVEACLQTGGRLLQEDRKEKQEMERKSWWFFQPLEPSLFQLLCWQSQGLITHPQIHKIDFSLGALKMSPITCN